MRIFMFSASFQTFCLTARPYLNTQKYRLFCSLKQNKIETFQFVSAVRGYHIYKDIWEPAVGEKLIAHREFDNQFDKLAIKVFNGEETPD